MLNLHLEFSLRGAKIYDGASRVGLSAELRLSGRASLAGERRRAGFSVPDNAYPAGVNPSWWPTIKLRHSPGWK
jgi:hypothetical protein